MISIKQIRAARALLGWSQQELADAAMLSKNAIAQLEQGQVEPRTATLESIASAFLKVGIEFIDSSGVRLMENRIEVKRYDGEGCVELYLRNIFDEVDGGDEVLVNGIEEHRLQAAAPEAAADYFKRARELKIRERIITPDDNHFFYEYDNISYRTLSHDYVGAVPHVIYGNTVAIWTWGPPTQIVLLRDKAVADSFRRMFELQWKVAKPKEKS
jgi:transcriptional regulator with XRE-family HTH domain